MARVIHRGTVIAHHLIWTGYGIWLPNDVRGSGSAEVRVGKLADLGPIHHGRKIGQPTRDELREFHRQAEDRLEFAPLWFGADLRQAIASAIGAVVRARGHTVWALAVLRGHVHACVRVHRDDYETMWRAVARASRDALRQRSDVPPGHPVWSERPYSVYLKTPEQVRGRIGYIERNPIKEGLPPQHWAFVRPYDGWPFHREQSPAPNRPH